MSLVDVFISDIVAVPAAGTKTTISGPRIWVVDEREAEAVFLSGINVTVMAIGTRLPAEIISSTIAASDYFERDRSKT